MKSSFDIDRRRFATLCGALAALAGTTGLASGETASLEQVRQAVALAGLDFSDEEIELLLPGLEELSQGYGAIRELEIDNSVVPALQFHTLADEGASGSLGSGVTVETSTGVAEGEIAWLGIAELSRRLRRRELSATELTKLALDRLERHDSQLQAVITLTTERALEAAAIADAELDQGIWRGPLHGLPWGAKDLLSVPGYPTTWGAKPYAQQQRHELATVVDRLDRAGATLVAKLSLGALAWGDVWFGGTTKNPWDLEQGSSGSSAGPAAAVAAGLVPFAIGSETLGSIVSPCTRCGLTGLRPTFGRVPRGGAMALSWSMDKLGPIARSALDCGLVFAAIHGADDGDPSAQSRPFDWDPQADPRKLRIGVLASLFETETDREAWRTNELRVLESLRGAGIELVPIELPDFPTSALSSILTAEAAAAFDELTLSGRDDELVRQIENAWPNTFRQARTIPAVEYIQANRARTLLMRHTAATLEGLDGWISPSFGGSNLLLTNLTGHPCVVAPTGFDEDGHPTSITFCGQLWREDVCLALAHLWQGLDDSHARRPPGFE